MQEGKGIYYYKNGDRCEGDWKKGNKVGKGKYYNKNDERNKDNNKNEMQDENWMYILFNFNIRNNNCEMNYIINNIYKYKID